jgi:predicted MFS family arabinose efflux permease
LLATPEASLSSAPREGPKSAALVARRVWQAMREQGPWLGLFLLYAKLGETFGGALVEPMLVDRGFSREQIGTLAGIFGGVATIVGAIASGLIARRAGWWVAIAIMSLVQGTALVAIGVYQTGEITSSGIAILIALEKLAGGGVGVGVFAFAMSVCKPEVGASQFTAAQVVYMAGAVIGAPLAGIVGDATGAYLPVMATGGAMAIGLAALAAGPARRLGRRVG